MCGRFACCLQPGVIQKACCYYDADSKTYKQPEWREHPAAGDPEAAKKYLYTPSANMAPTKFSPVMYRYEEIKVLQPMLWGIIPPWHTGDPKSHKYSTINARVEGLERSRLFKRAVHGRQFCVVVAQGFYEWKAGDKKKKTPKQPYFLFMKQEDRPGDDAADEDAWNRATWSENEGWKGPKILMMAGLYDIWHSPQGEMVCSFTIITQDTHENLKWLHPRLPAVLETPEQVEAWLNPDPEEKIEKHLTILQPATKLDWYTVHPKVGDWRCQDPDCAKRYEIQEQPPPETVEKAEKPEDVKHAEETVVEAKTEQLSLEERLRKEAEEQKEEVMVEPKPHVSTMPPPKAPEQMDTEAKVTEPQIITEAIGMGKEAIGMRKEAIGMVVQDVEMGKDVGMGKENVQEGKSKTTDDIEVGESAAIPERKRRASSEDIQTAKKKAARPTKKVSAA